MKSNLRVLSWMACLSFVLFLSFPAWADGSFGVGDSFQADGSEVDVSAVESCAAQAQAGYKYFQPLTAPDMSCQTRDKIEDDFNTASVVLGAGSAITACTAAGAPVSVVLSLGAAVSATVEMVVKHMNCDDSATQAQIESQTKSVVCDVLAKQGISCNSD